MAQLGARFHGMEEVVSSNLTRSTTSFITSSSQWCIVLCSRANRTEIDKNHST